MRSLSELGFQSKPNYYSLCESEGQSQHNRTQQTDSISIMNSTTINTNQKTHKHKYNTNKNKKTMHNQTGNSSHTKHTEQTGIEHRQYKQMKLKGKHSHKQKYLIIIDDDQSGQQQLAEHNRKESVKRHLVSSIEKQIQDRIMRINSDAAQSINHTKNTIQTNPTTSLHKIQQKQRNLLRKTHSVTVNREQRPKTRSSKLKTDMYYERSNYAVIPELLRMNSAGYRQMAIRKCISLRSREYIRIIDQTGSECPA